MSDRLSTDRAVAIIGIGCRFPGGITDPRSFWSFVAGGGDAITEVPRDRFDLERYFDARPATPGRSMTRWGGFLGALDKFDAEFFGLSPREAARLDPQQRLLLETAWESLEDAGQDVKSLEGSVTGVYIGQWVSDFESRLFADPQTVDFYTAMGTGRYASSGRLSYLLGLRGPSLTLDTACSSSLVAVHLAMQSIRSGESTLAIAGGVNLILQPQITIAYSQTRMMAPDGRCKFGDAAGDGYVRSEGAGLVVLKSLDRAILDGDRIYAVIRGSAVNNDGHSSGSMGRPSRIGQEELLRAAYRDAGVAPCLIGYVEAHGTGTRAGDPVELDALGAVLCEGRARSDRAQVGSVKTNFGHTEGAAGVAGLIKAALSLHHAEMAPSLHCKTLNPKVAWDTVPLEIVRERRPWGVAHGARVAVVTAFGIGGTNAHVVLESAPVSQVAAPVTRAPHLLALSARSPAALRDLCTLYGALLRGADARRTAVVCAGAASRRTALPHRAICVAADGPAIAELLAQQVAGDAVLVQEIAPPKPHRIAFVIPGQGGQWDGMGRELYATDPVFRAAFLECDRAARPYIRWSLEQELHRDRGTPGYGLDRIEVVQPLLFALAIAYARWLRTVGIVPDAVVGHSMGEVAAAHLAGALSLDQAMQIICRRSALMQPMSGRGAMAVVDLPAAEAERRLAPYADRLSVAVRNSAHSSVIAGDPEALAMVLAACEAEGIFCRRVNIDVASHSPQMDAPAAALVGELRGLAALQTALPLYSSVLAREAHGHELDAAYWGQNMRQPVRFDETVTRMVDDGLTVFVELSPHAVLKQAIEHTARAAGAEYAIAFACGRRGAGEQTSLLRAAGRLWALGSPVELRKICGSATVDLPLYPWQRERHWIPEANARESMTRAPRAGDSSQDSLDSKAPWLHQLRWRALDTEPSTSPRVAPGARAWLVVADDHEAGARFAQALRNAGATAEHVTTDAMASALKSRAAAGLVVVLREDDGAAFETISVTQRVHADAKQAPERAPPRIWFISRGAQAVGSGARIANPGQGGAWGAARVLAAEHPEYWGGLIDLDPDASPAQNATDLVCALQARSSEDQLAIRSRRHYGLRLEPIATEALQSPPRTWRADGAYLISGGLGEIGLRIVRAMVRGGARRLILMGRTTLPQRQSWSSVSPDSRDGRRIAAVRELEAQGASIHLIAADVSRWDDLEAAIGRYRAESWPPIVGIVHAAGVVVNQLALNLDETSFDRAFAPKATGAQNLDRLFPDSEDFIVFSSITALLGWAGTANYAAGNAGADAIVAARRGRGASGLSIQWGTWTQTGVFAGEGADRYAAELERQGIRGFAADDGTAIFEWAAGAGLDTLTVMPIDWNRFHAAHAARRQAVFAGRGTETAAPPSTEQSFVSRLAALPSIQARQRLLEAAVLNAAAGVLGVSPQKLDIRKPLGSSGLDSIMAIELRNRLEGLLERPLSATLTWNYPTVESIARFLNDVPAGRAAAGIHADAEQLAEAPESAAPTSALRAPDRNLEQLADLSDEDVARQLRARVKRRG